MPSRRLLTLARQVREKLEAQCLRASDVGWSGVEATPPPSRELLISANHYVSGVFE